MKLTLSTGTDMYAGPVARLHIMNLEEGRRVEVTLSRRNLLTLIHKVDMPGSMRQIEHRDCLEDGRQTPLACGEEQFAGPPRTTLMLRCEDDSEHYSRRSAEPGPMHPSTERFIRERSATPELLPRSHLSFDDARDLVAGWHFNRRLSEGEQKTLEVAEALLRELERKPA